MNYSKLANERNARRDAQRLFDAGEDRWGTDEETFNLIFATRDFYQLREIYRQYVKVSGLGKSFLLPHLSIKCWGWAIVTGLCVLSLIVHKHLQANIFFSETTLWILIKLYRIHTWVVWYEIRSNHSNILNK